MPVYEYDCDQCGKRTEMLRSMSDADARVVCAHCGSDKTHRVHSVFTASATASSPTGLSVPPCGRCGDPRGSCGMA